MGETAEIKRLAAAALYMVAGRCLAKNANLTPRDAVFAYGALACELSEVGDANVEIVEQEMNRAYSEARKDSNLSSHTDAEVAYMAAEHLLGEAGRMEDAEKTKQP